MRTWIAWCVLMAALGSATVAAAAPKPLGPLRAAPPKGSYTLNCRSISVSATAKGDLLRAQCQSTNGSWVSSSLLNFRNCSGDIVNDDGRLECTRWAAQTPSGTYTQTCREIYVRGDTLYAKCKKSDGSWVWTQLNDWQRCTGGIVNLNGQLHCSR